MFHPKELVHWLETTTNLDLSGPIDERSFWSLYSDAGQRLSDAPKNLRDAAHKPCELLIVLTTYARESSCAEMLLTLPALLRRAGLSNNVHVLVLRDASSHEYAAARAHANALFGPKLTWLDARDRLGKAGYWKTYQTAFLAAKLLQPKHTLFLQDDVQYTATMLQDAYRLWRHTNHDLERRVFYLFSSHDDEPYGRWIHYRRLELPGGLVRRTQWWDLQSYFVDLRFFELLGYRIVPVHENRWRRRPGLSSGVGAQLTRRLFGQANVYQAMPPLVLHGSHESVMNPEARARRSLDNLSMVAQLRAPLIC